MEQKIIKEVVTSMFLIKRPVLITQDQLVTLLTQQHSTTHQPLLDPRSHQVVRTAGEACKLHGDGCITM